MQKHTKIISPLFCYKIVFLFGFSLLLLPTISIAGNSQYSRVRQISPLGKTLEIQGAGKPLADNASARTVFDIVISLYNKPTDVNYPNGDNDATVDAGANDDEQNAYEEVVRFFADGVCESTNGTHHLGEVRIFKNGVFASGADIVWKAAQNPSAYTSSFGFNGGRINFGDVFTKSNNFDFISTAAGHREAGGYTLAHEWGHYVLGLFDEYKSDSSSGSNSSPRLTDELPPFPAIMNTQWPAAKLAQNNRFRFLNFTQKDNFSIKTGQGRAFGKSGWEVLTQSTDQDPKRSKIEIGAVSRRTHYTTLDGKAPPAKPAGQATPNYTIELPAGQAACRQDLKIIWMQPNLELLLAVDTSASMRFQIANAQAAAKVLVDLVPKDKAAMGLLHFATGITTDKIVTPITKASGPGVSTRNDLKFAIDAFTAEGSTQLFDGAVQALTLLDNYKAANNTNATRMVFLFSDGDDTNSNNATEASVIAAYKAANVALSTFAYGDLAPEETLRRFASETNGIFRKSSTKLADI